MIFEANDIVIKVKHFHSIKIVCVVLVIVQLLFWFTVCVKNMDTPYLIFNKNTIEKLNSRHFSKELKMLVHITNIHIFPKLNFWGSLKIWNVKAY